MTTFMVTAVLAPHLDRLRLGGSLDRNGFFAPAFDRRRCSLRCSLSAFHSFLDGGSAIGSLRGNGSNLFGQDRSLSGCVGGCLRRRLIACSISRNVLAGWSWSLHDPRRGRERHGDGGTGAVLRHIA
jgi:hypothetical protein